MLNDLKLDKLYHIYKMSQTIRIVNEDCLEYLKTLKDNSIDCVITGMQKI